MFNSDEPLDLAAERVAFEKWFLTTQCKRNQTRLRRHVETDLYADLVVRVAWRAWRQGVARRKQLPRDPTA